MADEQIVEIGFLNIVATPHPAGVYDRLLRVAAGHQVQFFGDQKAAITAPRAASGEPHLLQGRIVVWTDIDEDQPGVNKRDLSPVRLADMDFSVPTNLGFNGKAFIFVFNTASHILAMEARNEFGQTLSTRRAKRIFDRLLSSATLGLDAELVEVTVIPEDDALAFVLGLDRIDKVEILVKRPNEDDITTKTNEIMAELMRQNAKSEDRILIREAGSEGIELSEENMIRAEVAASNGYVKSSGRDVEGETDTRSTKEYPKILRLVVDAGESFISKVRDAARNATARTRQR
jgi:hypothetical protein